MIKQQKLKRILLSTLISSIMIGCGGGGNSTEGTSTQALQAQNISQNDTLASEKLTADKEGKITTIKADGRVQGITASKDALFLAEGADGVESMVGRWAGLNCLNKLTDYHSGIQFEMANVNIEKDYIHIFFGNEIAPLGYAWIFPKDFSANVGLGILEKKAKMKAYDYLKNFIEKHKEFFANAQPIEINAGGVPVAHFTEMVADGVMLVGDAAQLVNPIHGGGIVRAIHSSLMAGEVASKALKEENLSKERLMEYERKWEEEYGEKTKKLMKLRRFLERLEDKDFEILADILQGEDIYALTQAKLGFFIKKIIKKPSLLILAKKYLMD